MKRGELYDEELLAKHLKEKGLLDDEALSRATRVRARLYEFELPRALDRILLDLGLASAEELEEAVKASKISDALTEHIPAAVMAGHAAKARTEVRERLDKMRQALDKPKKAGDHTGTRRAVPPAAIIAVCVAVTAVALAVLVLRFLPRKPPEPEHDEKPREFEPYSVKDDMDGLLGRVGFMFTPTSEGLIFVELPGGRRVQLKFRRVREDAVGYAESMHDEVMALAALRAGMALARSKLERARLLLAAARTAEGGLAAKLFRRLRGGYGDMTPLVERSYIDEGRKAEPEAACRAYRAYLRRYPGGEFVEEARNGILAAGSSPEFLPQPGEAPVPPEGSAIVVSEPFGRSKPGVYGRIDPGLDPGSNGSVLAARADPANGPFRAFVVLDDGKRARASSRLGFRALADRECLVEVSVLVLKGDEPVWLGFSAEAGPEWKTNRFSLGEAEGLRVHSVSFVAPADARGLYIDDLTLFESPR